MTHDGVTSFFFAAPQHKHINQCGTIINVYSMPCTRALCLRAHMRGRTCAGGSELIKVPSLYLLNVVVQRDDPQRGGEVGAGRDGGAHWRGLAHVSLVGGELEIGSLIVLIQDLDNEVSVGREGVSVVLLGLERAKGNILSVTQSNSPVYTLIPMWTVFHIDPLPLQWRMNIWCLQTAVCVFR